MDNQLMNLGLTDRDGKAIVSSRDIARVFDKRHDNVLRDIKNIVGSDAEWGLLNFEEMSYPDSYGRSQTEYAITRDGFAFLVMGYTGEKAMRFKKAYIAAFNDMERRLAPRNYKEALLALVAKEEERERLESQNKVLQLTASKYEGQSNNVGLYKAGEIAKELGISAKRLNDFLHNCRVQYKPNGSNTWQLYTNYAKDHIAVTQLVSLENGYDMPMLLWTPKGRDFIFDLAEREMPKRTLELYTPSFLYSFFVGGLCQMSNGVVYGDDSEVIGIHNHILDALDDLIEAEQIMKALSSKEITQSLLIEG